ncbi:MAG TPA: carboxypeptidase-like regulatory domain-containing protein, partial [Gemmatimonadales bacterium]|nr:carboxypeptidase-like regulatory domain-containing protein [Gemmatimonadales bacterium]
MAAWVALGVACAASEAPAQAVRGTVTSQRTGQPVGGAMVQLLDPAGAEVTRTQSDAEGRYGVRAPAPGTYRLRFLVPGYRSLVSLPLQIAAGQTLEYPLQLTAVAPELLDTLIVE